MSGRVVRLIVVAALFLGWLGWLGYAALHKNTGPVVSRAQAAAASFAVVADLDAGADGKPAAKAKAGKSLLPGGPAEGTDFPVVNLPDAAGFDGPGQYLLLLVKDPASEAYYVVGQKRSPGFDLENVGHPLIYRWSPDVEAQARRLFP